MFVRMYVLCMYTCMYVCLCLILLPSTITVLFHACPPTFCWLLATSFCWQLATTPHYARLLSPEQTCTYTTRLWTTQCRYCRVEGVFGPCLPLSWLHLSAKCLVHFHIQLYYFAALSFCDRCKQCQGCIWSTEDGPSAATFRAGTRCVCVYTHVCVHAPSSGVSIVKSVLYLRLCFMCNVADHRDAKEEASNLLIDTKKKLNERLQSAESETKKLKVCRVRPTGRLHTWVHI